MEAETPVPSEAPVKLTKSGKPRKPFVMTPAFEKCRLARLAKCAEAATGGTDPDKAYVLCLLYCEQDNGAAAADCIANVNTAEGMLGWTDAQLTAVNLAVSIT
jgi:hypothetical protein